MSPVPSSFVAAVLFSAAAGKNPWVPIGVLALVAAPVEVPSFVLEPAVQARLHSVAPPEVLYGIAAVTLALALLESLGDKVPGVEQWLMPLSSAWRPFAALLVSSLVAWAGMPLPDAAPIAGTSIGATSVAAQMTPALGLVALTIFFGTFAGYLATIGKVGARLVLSLVPVPGLKLVHSLVDDVFAVVATAVGIVFADSVFVAAIAGIYLLVGLFTGPLLARLAGIYLRILVALFRMASPDRRPVKIPAWARNRASLSGAPAEAPLLPAYVLTAPGIGRARYGYLTLTREGPAFMWRRLFRTQSFRVPAEGLGRIGFAETATSRAISITSVEPGATRERTFYLFPMTAHQADEAIERAVSAAELVPVAADSGSARASLPGFGRDDERYRPARVAGDLRVQALTTIVAATALGVLSMGLYIPIGAGYVFSPFPRRFAISTLVSIYLLFCALGTGFVSLPITVLYGVLLNVVAIRDLTRQAVKARTDGYLDKRAFLPFVAHRVWVHSSRVLDPADRELRRDAVREGPWRSVAAALA